MVSLYSKILFSPKKEGHLLCETWMNLEDIMRNKPDTERQMLHDLTYMWNLKQWGSQKPRVEWWLPEVGVVGVELEINKEALAKGHIICLYCGKIRMGLSWWLNGKEPICNTGGAGSIPGLGRPPGEGNGSPLQYSCLEKPMDGGVRRADRGYTKGWTQLRD